MRMLFILVITWNLVGCVIYPKGPSQMIIPSQTATFEKFSADDDLCRKFADKGLSGETTNGQSMSSGLLTMAMGTMMGAAIGAVSGGPTGAAIGAASGAGAGGLFGLGAGKTTAELVQKRYDNAYSQCMFTRGHQVPVVAMPVQSQGYSSGTLSSIPPPPPPYAGSAMPNRYGYPVR